MVIHFKFYYKGKAYYLYIKYLVRYIGQKKFVFFEKNAVTPQAGIRLRHEICDV